MDERERTARDNAIRKWSDALTVEDISGDPRDLTISIAQTMWQAGRDYALSAATASGETERMRAALEWYADEENYNDDHAPGCKSFMFDWTFDLGARAREALADRAAGEREA